MQVVLCKTLAWGRGRRTGVQIDLCTYRGPDLVMPGYLISEVPSQPQVLCPSALEITLCVCQNEYLGNCFFGFKLLIVLRTLAQCSSKCQSLKLFVTDLQPGKDLLPRCTSGTALSTLFSSPAIFLSCLARLFQRRKLQCFHLCPGVSSYLVARTGS